MIFSKKVLLVIDFRAEEVKKLELYFAIDLKHRDNEIEYGITFLQV